MGVRAASKPPHISLPGPRGWVFSALSNQIARKELCFRHSRFDVQRSIIRERPIDVTDVIPGLLDANDLKE